VNAACQGCEGIEREYAREREREIEREREDEREREREREREGEGKRDLCAHQNAREPRGRVREVGVIERKENNEGG